MSAPRIGIIAGRQVGRFVVGQVLEQMDVYSAQQRKRLLHDIASSTARTFPKLQIQSTSTGGRNRFV